MSAPRLAFTVVVAALVTAPALLGTLVAMPDTVQIPSVRPRAGGPPPARFVHSSHNNFMCHSCHPATFPTARVGFTHDDFKQGRFCASCHDGLAAWAIPEAKCERCHVAP